MSAWLDGYSAALIKLGWDPARVQQLIAEQRASVAKAHAMNAAGTAQRASKLVQSPRIQEMAQSTGMSPHEFALMSLGKKAPGLRNMSAPAVPPPIPQAARQVA